MSDNKNITDEDGEKSCWMCSCGAMNAVCEPCYRCGSKREEPTP